MDKALFLDRDGVVCEAMPRGDYLLDIKNCRLVAGIQELINAAKDRTYKVIMITNQAPIGKKILTQEKLQQIHDHMETMLGCRFDAIYFCPHQKGENCTCRKPAPGMLLKAAQEHNLDLHASIFVGDSNTDIEAGNAAGCKTIFMRNSHHGDELQLCNPDYAITDLQEAIALL